MIQFVAVCCDFVTSAHRRDTDFSCNREEYTDMQPKLSILRKMSILHTRGGSVFQGTVILIFYCFVSVCFQLM